MSLTAIISTASGLFGGLIATFVTIKVNAAKQNVRIGDMDIRINDLERTSITKDVFNLHATNDQNRLDRIESKIDMLIQKLVK